MVVPAIALIGSSNLSQLKKKNPGPPNPPAWPSKGMYMAVKAKGQQDHTMAVMSYTSQQRIDHGLSAFQKTMTT